MESMADGHGCRDPVSQMRQKAENGPLRVEENRKGNKAGFDRRMTQIAK